MNNFCTSCDKSFTTKQNYDRHLNSNKHKKQYVKVHEKSVNVSQKNTKEQENFKCNECSLTYTTKRGLVKHYNRCLVSKIHKLESEKKELQDKSESEKKELQDIFQFETESLKLEIKELKENSKESNKDFKDITKLALTNSKGNTNVNNSHNSNYQIIINQYKDAPNLTLPKDLEINESLDKSTKLDTSILLTSLSCSLSFSLSSSPLFDSTSSVLTSDSFFSFSIVFLSSLDSVSSFTSLVSLASSHVSLSLS